MPKPTLRERLAYAFDRSLSRGPLVLILWLAALSFLVIAGVSLLVWCSGIAPPDEAGRRPGLLQIAWMSLMRTLDSGTMGGDTGRWAFLFAMLAVTLGGIFVIGSFIGALTGAIEAKMAELRKGRSRVLENGHTLILGWSPRVFTIVSELVTANANQRGRAIVILGDKDKVEMEDELRSRVPDTLTTRVVCRSGDPSDLDDLAMANVQGCRSVIVLPPVGDEADAATIKTLLAVTNSPGRGPRSSHAVAEIRDPRNLAAARLAARGEAELVLVPELLARVAVQACRQSGLSVVYRELLDFGGDEIYFQDEPALAGATFGESLGRYADCSVIGIRFADGVIRVNPPMDTRFAAGDRVIAIAEDDDRVRLAPGIEAVDESAFAPARSRPVRPERTLILGWNDEAHRLVGELEGYVAPGSAVTILAPPGFATEEVRARLPATARQQLDLRSGDAADRGTLDALAVASFDHVILISPNVRGGDEGEGRRADARTLVTLLHLRDIREQGGGRFSIVSEMLDVRNRALAEVTRADDFIIGDQIVSLLLTQLSENRELNAVFQDLFDADGSEIYLKPATDYVAAGREVNMATVVECARRRGEIAIGYRLQRDAGDASRSYGVRTNPPKSTRVAFAEGDAIIVLAEN